MIKYVPEAFILLLSIGFSPVAGFICLLCLFSYRKFKAQSEKLLIQFDGDKKFSGDFKADLKLFWSLLLSPLGSIFLKMAPMAIMIYGFVVVGMYYTAEGALEFFYGYNKLFIDIASHFFPTIHTHSQSGIEESWAMALMLIYPVFMLWPIIGMAIIVLLTWKYIPMMSELINRQRGNIRYQIYLSAFINITLIFPIIFWFIIGHLIMNAPLENQAETIYGYDVRENNKYFKILFVTMFLPYLSAYLFLPVLATIRSLVCRLR